MWNRGVVPSVGHVVLGVQNLMSNKVFRVGCHGALCRLNKHFITKTRCVILFIANSRMPVARKEVKNQDWKS